MRAFISILCVSSCLWAISACKKKETSEKSPSGELLSQSTQASLKTSSLKEGVSLKAEGSLQYIHKDDQMALVLTNVSESVARLKQSQAYAYLQKELSEEARQYSEQKLEQTLGVIGEELFISLGKGGLDFLKAYFVLGQQLNQFRGQAAIEMLDQFVEKKETDLSGEVYRNKILQSLQAPEVVEIWEKAPMPLLKCGVKISDKEQREKILSFLTKTLESWAEEKEAISKVEEQGGLIRVRVESSKLINTEDLNAIDEGLDDISLVMEKILANKTFDLVIGQDQDFLLLQTVEKGAEVQFQLQEQSITSSGKMDFLKAVDSKDRSFYAYINEGILQAALGSGGLKDLLKGVVQGFKEAKSLKDPALLIDLAQRCIGNEEELYKDYQISDMKMIGWHKDGYQIRVQGGCNNPSLDLEKRELLPLVNREDTALWISARTNKAYSAKAFSFMSSFGEFAYNAVKYAVSLPELSELVGGAAMGFGMFDAMAAPSALNVWKAFSEDLHEGLGEEWVLAVDLKGSAPNLPASEKMPTSFLEHGPMPRITYGTQIHEKEKITEAWGKIKSLLSMVAGIAGQPQLAGLPQISEDEQLTIWSYDLMGMNTPQTNLCSAATDQLFFLSSSPEQVRELAKKTPKSSPGGMTMALQIDPIRRGLEAWRDLMKKEAKQKGEEAYNEQIERFEGLIQSTQDLDSLHMELEEKEGAPEWHFHLKTR